MLLPDKVCRSLYSPRACPACLVFIQVQHYSVVVAKPYICLRRISMSGVDTCVHMISASFNALRIAWACFLHRAFTCASQMCADIRPPRVQVIGEGKVQVSGSGQQEARLTDPKTGSAAGVVYFTVGSKQGGLGGAMQGAKHGGGVGGAVAGVPSPPPCSVLHFRGICHAFMQFL